MKKCALQIVSLCLAVFMLSVCGGVNIYHCCCDACTEHAYAILKSSEAGTHCVKHSVEEGGTETKSCSCGSCEHSHDNESGVIWSEESAECEVQHIEAPDFSHLSNKTLFSSLLSHFVAIKPHISIYNLAKETQNITSLLHLKAQSLARNLSGRAIIVRKSAYLI